MFSSLFSRITTWYRHLIRMVRQAKVSRRQFMSVWLLVLIAGVLSVGVADILQADNWSQSVWLFVWGALAGLVVLQLVRQHYLLQRIRRLEIQVRQMAETGSRPKRRKVTHAEGLSGLFDKNHTVH